MNKDTPIIVKEYARLETEAKQTVKALLARVPKDKLALVEALVPFCYRGGL